MAYPDVVSPEQWLEARQELLRQEKRATRERDALNAERRRLPMVRIEKDYVFEGPDGRVGLQGLFGDAQQLIVQHVMYDPEWDTAAPAARRPSTRCPRAFWRTSGRGTRRSS